MTVAVGLVSSTSVDEDLAGVWTPALGGAQVRRRIAALTQRYVTVEHLGDRLADLPHQFHHPQPRRWAAVPWAAIAPAQLSGIALDTFCAILMGAINTEAPIRGYTQASRRYLEHFYPQMAQFVGGLVDSDGRVIAPGLWEREEKRHAPVLNLLYHRLAGKRPTPVPHRARPYTPSGNPRTDLYRHGLHRIATEYGAACLYLWMMAHTTGPLQAVLGELLVDEINHMTKFWGFGRWAYPETGLAMVGSTLAQAMVQKLRHPQLQGSLLHTLRRMQDELAWPRWSMGNRLTFLYTLDQVMRVLWRWERSLTPTYLEQLFGPP
ncbi:ferritin-like domain-containing protein [Nodosilinea sp. PGN35]|uniref:ferritin-like domain-containing protein n=1 Tax=Nodosilinea sp. PGN35 TaxID=3020489 RepID=UPI0023B33FE5|nr:ferritin-like domain-containing protein [Nodosilinea sp. TSF1-S3]MDF0366694.1 ferritin-like domain-containing protein [Nodosilinea sp. TSF1-S3]